MIYIIRHGETDLNRRRVLQGRSDHPLNETGLAQARAAAESLEEISFQQVYTSPLLRARQTAQIIAPGVRPVVDRRLIEMDYGPYEGMDLHAPAPEVIEFFRDFVHNPAPPGMEPLEKVVERAGAFLEDLKGSCMGDILLSTHAITMKGLLEYLTPGSQGGYWSRNIGNCEVYVTEYRDGAYSVPEPFVKG